MKNHILRRFYEPVSCFVTEGKTRKPYNELLQQFKRLNHFKDYLKIVLH